MAVRVCLVISDLVVEMCEVLQESFRLRFDLLRVPLYSWDTISLLVRLFCIVFHFICGTRTYFRCQSSDLSFIEMYIPALSGLCSLAGCLCGYARRVPFVARDCFFTAMLSDFD